jgi:hypothetical protein
VQLGAVQWTSRSELRLLQITESPRSSNQAAQFCTFKRDGQFGYILVLEEIIAPQLDFLQMVFVDFVNQFVDFFLGRGSKPIISSHKHQGALPSQSCVFVRIWVYL